ncbi:MAG: amidohydrolase [Candidatus Abyssobacteria bacterium SURF_5]|uniref:Amidohydrolase n=1 Tax=Abyssobacteria bacterium (strain SURF_5) TaxID=2093360 RepID=A0A3A4NPE5_ABYX5|nr:MAG: amidohydrolase [Candidatus Abyssubacteria bacterium SURF_5]
MLLLHNANVMTLNPAQPHAGAVLIDGSRIKAVGAYDQLAAQCGPECEKMDLAGMTVLPGFIDCHMHPILLAFFQMNLDLNGVRSMAELFKRLADKTSGATPDQWILGLRFNEEGLAEQRLPTLGELDREIPDHPLIILRYCGHLAVANSRALAFAGITADTPNPHGGEIERDANGRLTGVVRETAVSLLTDNVPPPDWDSFMQAAEQTFQQLAAYGVTGIHGILQTSGNGPSGNLGYLEISALKALRNKIPQRLYLMIMTTEASDIEQARASELHDESPDSTCKVGAWKIICDGSLGGHSAVMYEPYSDAPAMSGIMVWSEQELEKMIFEAHRSGIQLAIHCIGDRMSDIVIRILERALAEHPRENHRHRIEHASVITPDLIQRARRLGVILSVQPPFIYSEREWLGKRVGKRLRNVYPFHSLLEHGLTVCAGSDAPIEVPDPILGIYSAANRLGVTPEEAVGVDDAIRMYTSNAAYAAFEENTKGTIEAGKLADLVVLSQNPLAIPAPRLREISVEMTMVGGKVIFSR